MHFMKSAMQRQVVALLLGTILGTSVTPADAASARPLTLDARIPLGEVSGRIDHLAFDAGRKRIYVAELGNGSVGVVDLKARRVIQTISGFEEPQGIAYEPGTDTIYVANGGDGSVTLLSGADLSVILVISLGEDADNVRIDPATHRVFVGHGHGALAVIGSTTGQRIADIPLAAHPESFQLDPSSATVFVNVPDARQIAVVSRETNEQTEAWPTGKLRANYPLVLDAARSRVISVFRRPARLQAYALDSGRALGGSDTCSDSDDVFVDAGRRQAHVICGEGYVDTFDTSDNDFARIGRFTTSAGSRTGLFVPEVDRLIVAIRANGDESAALWLLQPGAH